MKKLCDVTSHSKLNFEFKSPASSWNCKFIEIDERAVNIEQEKKRTQKQTHKNLI